MSSSPPAPNADTGSFTGASPWHAAAEAQARTGDRDAARRSIDEAAEIAERVAGDCEHGWLLSDIALAQATAGDNRAAVASARRIESEPGRDAQLANICEVQCWENNDREAIATAREIVSTCGRSEALVEIARHRVRDGDIAGAAEPIALAVEAAEAVTDPDGRAGVLARIAGIQLDTTTGLGPA